MELRIYIFCTILHYVEPGAQISKPNRENEKYYPIDNNPLTQSPMYKSIQDCKTNKPCMAEDLGTSKGSIVKLVGGCKPHCEKLTAEYEKKYGVHEATDGYKKLTDHTRVAMEPCIVGTAAVPHADENFYAELGLRGRYCLDETKEMRPGKQICSQLTDKHIKLLEITGTDINGKTIAAGDSYCLCSNMWAYLAKERDYDSYNPEDGQFKTQEPKIFPKRTHQCAWHYIKNHRPNVGGWDDGNCDLADTTIYIDYPGSTHRYTGGPTGDLWADCDQTFNLLKDVGKFNCERKNVNVAKCYPECGDGAFCVTFTGATVTNRVGCIKDATCSCTAPEKCMKFESEPNECVNPAKLSRNAQLSGVWTSSTEEQIGSNVPAYGYLNRGADVCTAVADVLANDQCAPACTTDETVCLPGGGTCVSMCSDNTNVRCDSKTCSMDSVAGFGAAFKESSPNSGCVCNLGSYLSSDKGHCTKCDDICQDSALPYDRFDALFNPDAYKCKELANPLKNKYAFINPPAYLNPAESTLTRYIVDGGYQGGCHGGYEEMGTPQVGTPWEMGAPQDYRRKDPFGIPCVPNASISKNIGDAQTGEQTVCECMDGHFNITTTPPAGCLLYNGIPYGPPNSLREKCKWLEDPSGGNGAFGSCATNWPEVECASCDWLVDGHEKRVEMGGSIKTPAKIKKCPLDRKELQAFNKNGNFNMKNRTNCANAINHPWEKGIRVGNPCVDNAEPQLYYEFDPTTGKKSQFVASHNPDCDCGVADPDEPCADECHGHTCPVDNRCKNGNGLGTGTGPAFVGSCGGGDAAHLVGFQLECVCVDSYYTTYDFGAQEYNKCIKCSELEATSNGLVHEECGKVQLYTNHAHYGYTVPYKAPLPCKEHSHLHVELNIDDTIANIFQVTLKFKKNQQYGTQCQCDEGYYRWTDASGVVECLECAGLQNKGSHCGDVLPNLNVFKNKDGTKSYDLENYKQLKLAFGDYIQDEKPCGNLLTPGAATVPSQRTDCNPPP